MKRFALLALFLGCASPTLPLPPPAIPSVVILEGGNVHLRSVRGVEPNALVVLTNDRAGLPNAERAEAVFADDEGSWEETIVASPGDVIAIVQEFGTSMSPPTTVQIPSR